MKIVTNLLHVMHTCMWFTIIIKPHLLATPTLQAVLSMMDEMELIKKWRIPRPSIARYPY